MSSVSFFPRRLAKQFVDSLSSLEYIDSSFCSFFRIATEPSRTNSERVVLLHLARSNTHASDPKLEPCPLGAILSKNETRSAIFTEHVFGCVPERIRCRRLFYLHLGQLLKAKHGNRRCDESILQTTIQSRIERFVSTIVGRKSVTEDCAVAIGNEARDAQTCTQTRCETCSDPK